MRNDTAVLHRRLQRPHYADHAVGSTIYRDHFEGAGIIDLSSGAGVSGLGHSCNAVKRAMMHQINQVPYLHSGTWTVNKTEALAEQLIGMVMESANSTTRNWRQGAAFFLNSGAEAVEAACKVASQYFREIGNNHVPMFCARQHSYHGNTLFTLALGDHPRKSYYAGQLPHEERVFRFPAFMPSRAIQPVDYVTYTRQALEALELKLQMLHATSTPAIVVVEPIGGMAIGIEPATTEYLTTLRDICTRYHALLIYDEVLSGNYRTGHLFAWQHYARKATEELDPDIVVTGKGLTAGYFPMSAVLVSGRIVDAIANGSHKLWHSTTNQNHPIGTAAGFAALGQYHQHRDQIEFIKQWIEQTAIPTLLQGPACVEQVIGLGAIYGIRLTANRGGLHQEVQTKGLNEGVAVYTDGATINGQGNFLLLAPPYVTPQNELNSGLAGLIRALNRVN